MVGIPPRLDKEPPTFWIFVLADGLPLLRHASEDEFERTPEEHRFFGIRADAVKKSKELLEKSIAAQEKVFLHHEKASRASKAASRKKKSD